MKYKNYYLLALRLVITLCLGLSFFNYWQSQEYLAPNNDKAYYLSVAEGLDKTGKLEDRTLHPHETVRSTQNGTIFVYTLFRQFTTNNETLALLGSLSGFLLLVMSIIVAYKLAISLGFSELIAHLIVFMIVFNASYVNFSYMGMTESFFYPLSLFWAYYHLKFIDISKSPNRYTWAAFILLSYLLIQFRVQGLLLFAASFLLFSLKGNWKRVLQVSTIYVVTLVFMLGLFYSLSGSVLGPGETGHLSNITKARSNWIIELIEFIQIYTTNLVSPYDTIKGLFLIFVSLPIFAFVFVGGIGRMLNKNIESHVLLYLIFAISITALWLFKPGMSLRYVYYTYPFFIILFFKYVLSIDSKTVRYSFLGLFLLAIINLGYIFYIKQIEKEYMGKQMIAERVNQHYVLKNLYSKYEPNLIYMSDKYGYHRRLVYTPTSQPVETRQDTNQIVPYSFVIGDTSYLSKISSSSKIDSTRKIGQFIYDGTQHKVYLIK